MKRRGLLSFLFLATLVSCVNQENKDDYYIGMDTDFESCKGLEDGEGKIAHVIILTGQSNCTGCSITSYLKDQVSTDVFSRYERGYDSIKINFNIDNHRTCSEGEWRKTDLMCGSYDEEFGPEVGMADTLNRVFPDQEFYILKISMSGYSLNYHWLFDGERSEIYYASDKFYKNGLNYLKDKGYKVSLDAVCWMQGESDTTTEKANKYYDNQLRYISYLREDLKEYVGEHGLYFIDAGISDSPYCLPGYPTVNEAKKKIADLDGRNIYFSTIENGLTTMKEPYYEPDLGHYDALSEIRLGELFAENIVKIYQ